MSHNCPPCGLQEVPCWNQARHSGGLPGYDLDTGKHAQCHGDVGCMSEGGDVCCWWSYEEACGWGQPRNE